MPTLRVSPPDNDIVLDLDIDLTHKITIPMGSYLPASGWTFKYIIQHPKTLQALLTYTNGGEIVVTTAGSSSVNALVTVTIEDSDIDTEFSTGVWYKWKFKRNDAGSEVNIDGGRVMFVRSADPAP